MPSDPTPEWFAARLPKGWFTGPPRVLDDSEEILVVGELADVEAGASGEARERARHVKIQEFRRESREQRMAIAAEGEKVFHRRVSWAVECGGRSELFTTTSVPVMTRLRMPERQVLDTLVAAGVARSRSDALAWCVRLVGRHQGDWIEDLRQALRQVNEVRAKGPE